MSKASESKDTKASAPQSTSIPGAQMTPPEGLKKLATDIAGFWDEGGFDRPGGQWTGGTPIYCKILFAREVIPTSGPSKGKTKRYLVVGLLAPTQLLERKGSQAAPARVANKGEIVGLWVTPGLSDLNSKGGCKVWVLLNTPDKWKDTGKGNPMKTYDIRAEEGGTAVKVVSFAQSQATQTVEGEPAVTPVTDPPGDDEIPF